MPRPTTRERRSDSRVGVKEGQCPIQDWIASGLRGVAAPLLADLIGIRRLRVWFLLDNEPSTCTMV